MHSAPLDDSPFIYRGPSAAATLAARAAEAAGAWSDAIAAAAMSAAVAVGVVCRDPPAALRRSPLLPVFLAEDTSDAFAGSPDAAAAVFAGLALYWAVAIAAVALRELSPTFAQWAAYGHQRSDGALQASQLEPWPKLGGRRSDTHPGAAAPVRGKGSVVSRLMASSSSSGASSSDLCLSSSLLSDDTTGSDTAAGSSKTVREAVLASLAQPPGQRQQEDRRRRRAQGLRLSPSAIHGGRRGSAGSSRHSGGSLGFTSSSSSSSSSPLLTPRGRRRAEITRDRRRQSRESSAARPPRPDRSNTSRRAQQRRPWGSRLGDVALRHSRRLVRRVLRIAIAVLRVFLRAVAAVVAAWLRAFVTPLLSSRPARWVYTVAVEPVVSRITVSKHRGFLAFYTTGFATWVLLRTSAFGGPLPAHGDAVLAAVYGLHLLRRLFETVAVMPTASGEMSLFAFISGGSFYVAAPLTVWLSCAVGPWRGDVASASHGLGFVALVTAAQALQCAHHAVLGEAKQREVERARKLAFVQDAALLTRSLSSSLRGHGATTPDRTVPSPAMMMMSAASFSRRRSVATPTGSDPAAGTALSRSASAQSLGSIVSPRCFSGRQSPGSAVPSPQAGTPQAGTPRNGHGHAFPPPPGQPSPVASSQRRRSDVTASGGGGLRGPGGIPRAPQGRESPRLPVSPQAEVSPAACPKPPPPTGPPGMTELQRRAGALSLQSSPGSTRRSSLTASPAPRGGHAGDPMLGAVSSSTATPEDADLSTAPSSLGTSQRPYNEEDSALKASAVLRQKPTSTTAGSNGSNGQVRVRQTSCTGTVDDNAELSHSGMLRLELSDAVEANDGGTTQQSIAALVDAEQRELRRKAAPGPSDGPIADEGGMPTRQHTAPPYTPPSPAARAPPSPAVSKAGTTSSARRSSTSSSASILTPQRQQGQACQEKSPGSPAASARELPQALLFSVALAPHYGAEVLIYLFTALAVWSRAGLHAALPACLLATFTFANLAVSAKGTRAWYARHHPAVRLPVHDMIPHVW